MSRLDHHKTAYSYDVKIIYVHRAKHLDRHFDFNIKQKGFTVSNHSVLFCVYKSCCPTVNFGTINNPILIYLDLSLTS